MKGFGGVFRRVVENHDSSRVEQAEKAARLASALTALGFRVSSRVLDRGRYFKPPKADYTSFPEDPQADYIKHLLGSLELGSGNAKVELAVSGASEDNMRMVFVPDNPSLWDPGRATLDNWKYGIGLGLRITTILKDGEKAVSTKRLGSLTGVDREGNPIILVHLDEIKDDQGRVNGGDVIGSPSIIDQDIFALNPESARYQEIILALYGAADNAEAVAKDKKGE